MDYSSIHENDDPQAGSSPWASSPQQDRNFSRNSTEGPPSPVEARLGPSAVDSSSPRQEYRQSPTAQQQPQYESRNETSTLPYRDQGQRPPQPVANGQQGTNHQQQSADGHQRHMYGQQQRQQRPRPKYTMIAKLNGMERAGRKDPMFRFDVHVRVEINKIPWICTG